MRAGALLAIVMLTAATLLVAPHGHGPADAGHECAACAFHNTPGEVSTAPLIPAPAVSWFAAPLPLVSAPHTADRLDVAPKQGPPA